MAISAKRRRELSLAVHTCDRTGAANCKLCMRWQVEIWDAINRYVVACDGDPTSHVHGNTARMNTVVDVNSVVRRAANEDLIR